MSTRPFQTLVTVVRCIVKNDSNLGVIAIQTENLVLTLTREQSAVNRHTAVVSHIRPTRRCPDVEPAVTAGVGAKTPVPSKTQPLGDAEKSTVPHERCDRSRSPAKKDSETPVPFSDKIEVVDCGAGGNCGYLSLAMALNLEKGEAIDIVRPLHETRAKTIRHDLYKHMKKHSSEYEEWYSPALLGTEEIEAGPIPVDWEFWLECALRNGRWIDGLSLLAAASRFGTCMLSLALEIQRIGLCFSARPDRERRRSYSCCVVITISLRPSSLGSNGLRHGSKLKRLPLLLPGCEVVGRLHSLPLSR